MNILEGNEQFNTGSKHTQVFLNTHDGAGARLPFMARSFISFTYGGKPIEDFGLIATFNQDFYNGNLYADFEDEVSNYEVLDGQYYWGSHFAANQLEFTLSTDSMTELQLLNFKSWFVPGKYRELILAEHPNRGILARISQPPSFSLLPFEEQITYQINEADYTTSTTVYRGSITLNFIMDDPFWYGIQNFIPEKIYDVNGNLVNSLENKDCLKIIYEDGVPHETQLIENCFLSNEYFLNGENSLSYLAVINDGEKYGNKSKVGYARLNFGFDKDNPITITVTSTPKYYIYYCGNAPSYPKIMFTLTPQFDAQNYIIAPYNTIRNINTPAYNVFSIGDSSFAFTTPSLYTGYNQALQIVDNLGNSANYVDVYEALQIGIKEYYSRAWAIGIIEELYDESQSNFLAADWNATFHNLMKQFLGRIIDSEAEPSETETSEVETGTFEAYPATFIFDSATGEAIGKFQINTNITAFSNDNLTIASPPIEKEQNVGDMIRSNFLVIKDRNMLTNQGQMAAQLCSAITTDYPAPGLQNVVVSYKNMYL